MKAVFVVFVQPNFFYSIPANEMKRSFNKSDFTLASFCTKLVDFLSVNQ